MDSFYEDLKNDFSIEKGAALTFEPHLHQHIEFYYVCEGETEITISDKKYTLSAGDLAIAFPNEIHSYTVDKHCERIMLLFTADYATDYINLFTKYRPKTPVLYHEQVHPIVKICLNTLLKEKDDIDFRLAKAYISVIVGNIIKCFDMEKFSILHDLSLPEQALIYMNEHFREKLSLEKLASVLGINKNYLSRIFSQKIGITFNVYLTSLRMKHAQKLLIITNKSITDIAYESGYDCLRSFNRTFSLLFNITPRQYRIENSDSSFQSE